MTTTQLDPYLTALGNQLVAGAITGEEFDFKMSLYLGRRAKEAA